jgi:hypothetical protein
MQIDLNQLNNSLKNNEHFKTESNKSQQVMDSFVESLDDKQANAQSDKLLNLMKSNKTTSSFYFKDSLMQKLNGLAMYWEQEHFFKTVGIRRVLANILVPMMIENINANVDKKQRLKIPVDYIKPAALDSAFEVDKKEFPKHKNFNNTLITAPVHKKAVDFLYQYAEKNIIKYSGMSKMDFIREVIEVGIDKELKRLKINIKDI